MDNSLTTFRFQRDAHPKTKLSAQKVKKTESIEKKDKLEL